MVHNSLTIMTWFDSDWLNIDVRVGAISSAVSFSSLVLVVWLIWSLVLLLFKDQDCNVIFVLRLVWWGVGISHFRHGLCIFFREDTVEVII